ncbi:hypothetical protein P8452_13543 [Trifolium repens]|nr:hypothetical protein P8452_13543 [Trifolium repens]
MEYKITREIRLVVTTGKKFGKDLGNCGIFLKMMLLKRKRWYMRAFVKSREEPSFLIVPRGICFAREKYDGG